MNDLPTLPDHSSTPGVATPVVAPAQPQAAPRSATILELLQRPINVVVLVLAILLAAHAVSTRNNIHRLRTEMAKSVQKGEMINTETSALARSVQDIARDLQAKVTLLENRQTETQGQQLALEQLYQDLSKNRDEWALAEIEQVLSTASQQLQLAGNVQGALIALQNADRSLSRSDKPQFITIRRAIAKDIDKLKALPALDLAGVAVRIDNVIAQVDTLPLLAGETPARAAPPARPVRTPKVKAKPGTTALVEAAPLDDSLWTRTQDTWRAWSNEMWTDVRELIRVRRVDEPAALMLAPNQAYFVRENLKLRLLNARLALMSRNETAFRSDLAASQEALVKYFDTAAGPTQTAQALLRQVQANNLAIEMPSLSDSLNAVRNYKSKP